MKESIVILEGIDKSGKTSIKNELIKQSNGKCLVIDRAFISQIAYSRIFKREIDETFFRNQAIYCFNLGYNFVYLYANNKDIKKRIIKEKEQDINEKDIKLHKKIFESVVYEIELLLKIHKYNTSEYSISELAKKILNDTSK